MGPLTLLTVCVGMSCNITESNVPYIKVANREYANSMLDFLKAARKRLEGFSEWIKTTIKSSLTSLQHPVDRTVNLPLIEIQGLVDNMVKDKHVFDKCYSTAYTNMMEIALLKLPTIEECVKNFRTYAEAMTKEIRQKLNEMADLQKRMKLTIPECESGPRPDECIQSRTNGVAVSVNSYERYSRITTEQGTAKLYEKRDDAVTCQVRPLTEIQNEGDMIKSQAETCIKYA